MTKKILKRRKFFSNSAKLMGLFGTSGLAYSTFNFMSPGDISNNPHISLKNNLDHAADNADTGSSGALNSNATSMELSAMTIPQGASRIVAIGYIPVIVVHGSDGFKAFNATCTHLGCIVKWDNAQQRFICPCHAGQYDMDGNVTSGPPPRALTSYRVDQQGDALNISV